jgi:hypothetical protein
VKKLVITLLVLIALFVAADFGVAAAAEYQVSKKMREQLKLTQDPAVRINGFPFLTQAVAGDYSDIRVSADAVSLSNLRNVAIQADLHHARASLSDLVSGAARSVTIDDVQGSVKVRASDIGRVLGVPDLGIEAAPQDTTAAAAAGGTTPASLSGIKLTGSMDIAGMMTKFTVLGTLSLVNGEIQMTPHKLDASNTKMPQLPHALQSKFLQDLARSFRFNPGSLPFKVTPTAVRAESGALVIEGTAQHVVIGGSGISQ